MIYQKSLIVRGKYDISSYPDGYVNTWNWMILYLDAKIITSFNEDILKDRETDNPKYNFIWNEILRSSLKDDITYNTINEINGEPCILRVEIYPTLLNYRFSWYDKKMIYHFTENKNVLLTVDQTVKLLESGVFTDVVDNSIKDD